MWRDFQAKFQSLANEERANPKTIREDLQLRASCSYSKDEVVLDEKGKLEQGPFCLLNFPECGLWLLYGEVSENFRERFQTLATRAAAVLGPLKGSKPLDFWLHRLFLDLRENNRHELFAASDEGGTILHVCEASATFCSRLERKALERPGLFPDRNAKGRKTGRGDPEVTKRIRSTPNVVKRRCIVSQNPLLIAQGICKKFDDDNVPLPKSLEEAATWEKAYKAPIYRHRIDALISRDRKKPAK